MEQTLRQQRRMAVSALFFAFGLFAAIRAGRGFWIGLLILFAFGALGTGVSYMVFPDKETKQNSETNSQTNN